MMTNTYAEIEALYAEKIVPQIGELKKKIFWAFFWRMPFIVFLAITPVGLLILLISQKIPMVQQWFLSDFATTNFLWIDLIITLACCFISLQFNKLFMKEIWLKTNLMEIDFLDDYQNFIIKPLLLHLNQNLNIIARGEFSHKAFRQSNLFPTSDDDLYFSSERISDEHQKKFMVGFVKSMYSISNFIKPTTVFDGLMIQFTCSKAKKEQIYLFPDNFEKTLGVTAKPFQEMLNHKGAKLVTMDNPDFEKVFQVYTTDSVQTHYLLSTKWLEKLTDFQKELNVPISIALHSGMCYVALHGYESPFTPQQDLEKALTASGVYTQYIRLKKLFDQLEVLQQIGSTLNDD